MSWNYRLCSYTLNGETFFGIREVYYNGDGSLKGVCDASTDEWTTPDEVSRTLDMMRAATKLPILVLPRDTMSVGE